MGWGQPVSMLTSMGSSTTQYVLDVFDTTVVLSHSVDNVGSYFFMFQTKILATS